jgi:hypothetical protein
MPRALGMLRPFVSTFTLGAIALAAAGCATTSGAEARHVPRTGLKAADYYPLGEGWKWAYDLEKDGEKILATYSVIERTPGGATVLTGMERLGYAVTPDGIAQAEDGVVGDYVLKNPIAKGASWPVAGGTARILSTTDEITVEAGHYYDCAVIEVTRDDPPRISRTTFAPDVGPVALEYQVQDGGKFVVTARARLRSVTKPGDDPFAAPRTP